LLCSLFYIDELRAAKASKEASTIKPVESAKLLGGFGEGDVVTDLHKAASQQPVKATNLYASAPATNLAEEMKAAKLAKAASSKKPVTGDTSIESTPASTPRPEVEVVVESPSVARPPPPKPSTNSRPPPPAPLPPVSSPAVAPNSMAEQLKAARLAKQGAKK
jgi:hypothetical protein